MGPFTILGTEFEEELIPSSYDSRFDSNYANWHPPKCICGAKHTFTPQIHSDWCELWKKDQKKKVKKPEQETY